MKVIFLTLMAMISFATNSVLCRMALNGTDIDPIAFTSIRLLSGAVTLFILLKVCRIDYQKNKQNGLSWLASLCLLIYAMAFSLAYINIDAGTGAFILFGAVQTFMLSHSILTGSYLSKRQWGGLLFSILGLSLLLLPDVNPPPITSTLLMILAGGAWAFYSILGRHNRVNALSFTMVNFTRTLPFIIILNIITFGALNYDTEGVFYALASGSLASGAGYAVWFYVLPKLESTTASIVQLSVPVFAALFGVIVLKEQVSFQSFTASLMILFGIFIVLVFSPKRVI